LSGVLGFLRDYWLLVADGIDKEVDIYAILREHNGHNIATFGTGNDLREYFIVHRNAHSYEQQLEKLTKAGRLVDVITKYFKEGYWPSDDKAEHISLLGVIAQLSAGESGT
jgi:hypothetical protein